MVRSLSTDEQRLVIERGIKASRVFEVARQSTFTGAGSEPARYVMKYGDEEWQITSQLTDDTEGTPSSGTQPGVFIYTAVRRGAGLGAGAIGS